MAQAPAPAILQAASREDGTVILHRLRAETHEEHERLENSLDLLGQHLTSYSYRRLIERFYGFYFPWEREVARVLPADLALFFAERKKVPKLEADLRLLGCDDTGKLRLSEDLPALSSLPRLLGSLYVGEGATLGGQMISRHLEQTLGFQGRAGYSFFSSYGPDVGSMWRTFREVLVSHSRPTTHDETVEAARDTFRCIHDWLRTDGR